MKFWVDFPDLIDQFLIVSYNYGDDPIRQTRGSLKSFYHYDGQLSTRQLTDASAQVTDTYSYDAFGNLLQLSGATQNNYLYTGEQYDPNVGFYYLRARYYHASIGRFLTQDTWPGMQFEPMSLHRYLYCESGPVGKWDPNGNATLMEVVENVKNRVIIFGNRMRSAWHLLLSGGATTQANSGLEKFRLFLKAAKAAGNVSRYINKWNIDPKAHYIKHLPGGPGNWSKIRVGIDIKEAIRQICTLRNTVIMDNGPNSVKLFGKFPVPIGDTGQHILKLVIDESGNMWTFYPVNFIDKF